MRDSHAFKSPDRPISPIQELEDGEWNSVDKFIYYGI